MDTDCIRVCHLADPHLTVNIPCNHTSPVVSHERALGISELLNQHDDVLSELVQCVVIFVGGPLRVPIPPQVHRHHPVIPAKVFQLLTPREPELLEGDIRGERERGEGSVVRAMADKMVIFWRSSFMLSDKLYFSYLALSLCCSPPSIKFLCKYIQQLQDDPIIDSHTHPKQKCLWHQLQYS